MTYWLYDYAIKSGLKVSSDGVITGDGDLKIPLEQFAEMVANESIRQYISGVCSVIRNGETLH